MLKGGGMRSKVRLWKLVGGLISVHVLNMQLNYLMHHPSVQYIIQGKR